jgi:hypothetical protein
MIKVAGTMLNHLKGIINSAVTKITNSGAENIICLSANHPK